METFKTSNLNSAGHPVQRAKNSPIGYFKSWATQDISKKPKENNLKINSK